MGSIKGIAYLNVGFRLDDVRLWLDFWEDLAAGAGEVVPGHEAEEDGEEHLVPGNAPDVREGDVHQPVGGARENPQERQVEEQVVVMLLHLINQLRN